MIIKYKMNKSLKNKTINVLVENLTDDKTQVFGRSEYMTSVVFNGKKTDVGKIVQVKINKVIEVLYLVKGFIVLVKR